ncbi:MAG: shikimate kinase [Bacteroidota bacterium]
MRIFLVGFMGSGKTTIGRQLARLLDYRFIDMDDLIVKNEEMDIPAIFEKKGESYFRGKEQNLLHELKHLKNVVISTGGGVPCYFDNMKVIKESGISVYIKLPAGAIVQRLQNSAGKRPLVDNRNKKDLTDYVKRKLVEREPFYLQADYIVEGFNLSAEILAKQIEERCDK